MPRTCSILPPLQDGGNVAALGGADELFIDNGRLHMAPEAQQRQRHKRGNNPDERSQAFHRSIYKGDGRKPGESLAEKKGFRKPYFLGRPGMEPPTAHTVRWLLPQSLAILI
jgi:hypothetical protein